MKHLDLFSGIGGFALAAQWTWGKDYVNVAHSEIEEFPCKVYHKHFPESRCLGDITKIEWKRVIENSERFRCNGSQRQDSSTIRRFGKSCSRTDGGIHLLTGGFPCQPFSVAGKRRGTEDNRWLWPEMLRAIHDVKPRWVIAENVTGIIKLALDQVLADLETEGYATETFIIPACAVGAPHRRDRVWIVANSMREGSPSIIGKVYERSEGCTANSIGASDSNASNPDWEESWIEVATRLCTLDDGLPNGLVRPKGWRVNALKAGGNAIVPQVAHEIFKAIKEVER